MRVKFNVTMSNIKGAMKKMAEAHLDRILDYKEAALEEELRSEAKQWKAESIRDLSAIRPGGTPRNLTDFPYRVSGRLSKSIRYKIDVARLKNSLRIRIARWFESVAGRGTDDYGRILEHMDAPFSGYQERIKRRLDDTIQEVIKRNL